MSLALMSKPESLDIAGLDGIFENVEPLDGPDVTRVVIGEIGEDRLARIKRVSLLVLDKEVSHHDYFVNLAVPHDRFEEITIVYSSAWKVTPQAAASPQAVAEHKSNEIFGAVYHPASQPALRELVEIFDWYDSLDEREKELKDKNKTKKTPGTTPNISPNIYTVSGMEELVRYASFKAVKKDG